MSAIQSTEIIVLGGGPAGYVAAIRAAAKGYSVVCVSPELGGTCLHRGCIPSKFLLNISKQWDFITSDKSAKMGIKISDASFELPSMIDRKNKITYTLQSGIEAKFKKNNITWIKEKGELLDDNIVQTDSGVKVRASKAVILATGSQIINIPFQNPDQVPLDTSDTALNWTQSPKSLLVVGAGYIGLELASVWARFGAKVRVIDKSDKFLPFLDSDVSEYIFKQLSKIMDIKLGITIDKLKACTQNQPAAIQATLTDQTVWQGERVLCAVGRKADLSSVKIQLSVDNNLIAVDKFMQTNQKQIYAIGDITKGPMLAHKASEQAWIAVEHIYSQFPPNTPNIRKSCVPTMGAIPSVMYIDPEVAVVGLTEQELEKGAYEVHKISFNTNGRAFAYDKTDGFIKIICDKKDQIILGGCVVGERAESIVCQIAVAMAFGATMNDLATICYPHPSFDESLRDLAFEASVWG